MKKHTPLEWMESLRLHVRDIKTFERSVGRPVKRNMLYMHQLAISS